MAKKTKSLSTTQVWKALLGGLVVLSMAQPAAAQYSDEQQLEASWGLACTGTYCPKPLPEPGYKEPKKDDDAGYKDPKKDDHTAYEEPKKDYDDHAPVYPNPPKQIHPIKLELKISPHEVYAGQYLTVTVETNKKCELWLVDQSPTKGVPAAVLSPSHPAYGQFVGSPILHPGEPRLLQFKADNNPGHNTLVAICIVGYYGDYGLEPDHIKSQLDGYRATYGHDFEVELSKHIQRALPADKVAMVAKTVLIR